MNSWHNKSTDLLCEAMLQLKTKEECYAFLEDVCTIKEALDMSRRIQVAKLLSEGENHASVGRQTGASSATISRVKKSFEYGAGGYKKVIERLNKEND